MLMSSILLFSSPTYPPKSFWALNSISALPEKAVSTRKGDPFTAEYTCKASAGLDIPIPTFWLCKKPEYINKRNEIKDRNMCDNFGDLRLKLLI
jgi:hypothetical protein